MLIVLAPWPRGSAQWIPGIQFGPQHLKTHVLDWLVGHLFHKHINRVTPEVAKGIGHGGSFMRLSAGAACRDALLRRTLAPIGTTEFL
jgi:hypothetical protein